MQDVLADRCQHLMRQPLQDGDPRTCKLRIVLHPCLVDRRGWKVGVPGKSSLATPGPRHLRTWGLGAHHLGLVLLLSGGQALLASRLVAYFSSQVFHSFSCRSGLSSADLELIPRCSFSLSNAKDWFCRQCFLWLPRQLAAQIWSMSSVKR
jgi:hypothetical protein